MEHLLLFIIYFAFTNDTNYHLKLWLKETTNEKRYYLKISKQNFYTIKTSALYNLKCLYFTFNIN